MDQADVEREAERGHAGRFGAGLPRISDGQLLFLQHMLNRMKPPEEGGGRVAIVMNGSPLFTGDAGSGESEIRRWILENDWLEAIVALPEQLFYNTGIATYIWVLCNRKQEGRRGKVQLIDATDLWAPMRKSLGNKRREISPSRTSSRSSRSTRRSPEAATLQDFPHHGVRLPQDHRRAAAAAELPGQPGADRAFEGAAGIPGLGGQQEEGRGEGRGRGAGTEVQERSSPPWTPCRIRWSRIAPRSRRR